MKIWVDADACPKPVKEILFRAADRNEVKVILVANMTLFVPPSSWIQMIRVAPGFDVADNYIVQKVQPGDLVITADIPMAAEVIKNGGICLNPRGELMTSSNIQGRLTMRNFLEELRGSNVQTGGPPPFTMRDRQNFANELDKYLREHLEESAAER